VAAGRASGQNCSRVPVKVLSILVTNPSPWTRELTKLNSEGTFSRWTWISQMLPWSSFAIYSYRLSPPIPLETGLNSSFSPWSKLWRCNGIRVFLAKKFLKLRCRMMQLTAFESAKFATILATFEATFGWTAGLPSFPSLDQRLYTITIDIFLLTYYLVRLQVSNVLLTQTFCKNFWRYILIDFRFVFL